MAQFLLRPDSLCQYALPQLEKFRVDKVVAQYGVSAAGTSEAIWMLPRGSTAVFQISCGQELGG